jgi:superfamily I DNA/RNA helicase
VHRRGYRGIPLHEFYVDEVQDFLECELYLLAKVIRDPNRLFLTGDTAQTIARGLSFRFADIKSIFHKLQLQNARVGVPSEVVKLVNNYRTHSGILNVANAVIDAIYTLFPSAIDKLEHDKGLFDGTLTHTYSVT